jgi:predicted RNase H-like HicB family nuclease/ABC-type nitrate/sulfonate/bicarbonate transport system substrate-binding protein
MSNKPLDYYLNAQYTIILEPGPDGWYGGEILEIPECIAQGQTPEETLSNLEEARRLLIEWNYEEGKEIPVPSIEQDYSRSYLLRMPPSLHRQLKKNAEREGISLNQHINLLLGRNSSIEIVVDATIEKLDEKFSSLSQKISSLDATIEKLDEKFSSLSQKISQESSSLNATLEKLDKKVSSIAERDTYKIGVGLYLESMLIFVGKEQGLFEKFDVQILPWDENFFDVLSDGTVSMIIGNRHISDIMNKLNKQKSPHGRQYIPSPLPLYAYKGFAIMVNENSGLNDFDTYYKQESEFAQQDSKDELIQKTLQQLKDKKIIAAKGTDHTASLKSCLKRYGLLEENEYTLIGNYEPNEGLQKFLAGESDAYVGGIPQRVVALSQGKKELISQDQAGLSELIQFNVLITNEDEDSNNSDKSEKMIRDFEQDWRKIARLLHKNKEEYCSLIVKKFNEKFNENSDNNYKNKDISSIEFPIDPQNFVSKYASKFTDKWIEIPKDNAGMNEIMELLAYELSLPKSDVVVPGDNAGSIIPFSSREKKLPKHNSNQSNNI